MRFMNIINSAGDGNPYVSNYKLVAGIHLSLHLFNLYLVSYNSSIGPKNFNAI